MKKYIGIFVKFVAQKFGKRITNIHTPAKPFAEGVVFLKQFIEDPKWVIDVGAASGTPDITSTFTYDKYRHLLIEADPKCLVDLEAIKKQYPETVVVEECFCGSKDEDISVHFTTTNNKTSRYDGPTDTSVTTEVAIVSLDRLMEKHNITDSVLLKIDTEGSELDVLMGAEKLLNNCVAVILEAWVSVSGGEGASDFADLVGYMKQRGFVVFDIFGGHNHKNGVLKHVDLVFVPEAASYRSSS